MFNRTLIAAATLSLCFFSQTALSAGAKTEKTDSKLDKKDKASYSIGVDVGRSIEKQHIEINPDMFVTGLKDGLANKYGLLTEEEVKQTLMGLQSEIMERQTTEMKAMASKNLEDGDKFLAENKKQKGVITLPSGLQYRIIKEGSGDSPKATDTVTTHYRGKLINGTEFDSSYTRGEPARFAVNAVIPGWTEALQLMKPGAKWELFIPPKLAYGENGIGQLIGPNSTLVFEVELLNVDKAKAEPAQDNKAAAKPNKK